MSNHISQHVKKSMRVVLRQPGTFFESFGATHNQVNVLTVLILTGLTAGFTSHFFPITSPTDSMLAVVSLLFLAAVLFLNNTRRYEAANVLFYVALNVVSLTTLRSLPIRPVEPILTYIFLLSLVVFLFHKAFTRLLCMSIILFRIGFFEFHTSYIAVSAQPDGQLTSEIGLLVFDIFLLLLIVSVFLFYGIKIYTIEIVQKKNAEFAQHMTHDLQVSYHSVSSIIEHLKYATEKNRLPANEKLLIEEATNASRFHNFILSNFLEFSRYEHASIESNHLEEIDLTFELERIVRLYQYMAEEKGVRIQLAIEDNVPGLIVTDKIKVTRIVLNLLTNAINHTARDKTITLTTGWKKGTWELSVINESDGLRAEDLQDIFKTYTATENQAGKRRLGLGLPITKQLVEALGGRITANVLQNHETRFTVAFPAD